MSEDLFYNRDRNIYGITAPENFSNLSFTPVYGSRVEYTSRILSYETDDSYSNMIPASLNNLSVSYKVRYDVNEDDCAKLINFFESKEGYQSFVFNPDNSGIYKSNQSFCENYAVNYINNNHYEFAVDVSVDQAPSFFNWRSSYFLNFDSEKLQNPFNSIIVKWKDYNTGWSNLKVWATGNSYKKYDILYSNVNTNKLNNFYYCNQDHVSSLINSPNTINQPKFQIVLGNFTWSGAKADAESKGGRLAVLNTLEKQRQIPINSNYLWIGATDTEEEGVWKWLDGSLLNDGYTNWSNYEPNNAGGNENYLIMYPDNKWNDLNNNYGAGAGYILEKLNTWSQDFFFSPDIGFQNDVKIQVSKLEFKNSFPLRIKTKNNTAKFDINYKFTNIDDKQLLCMLHFLENKAGYRKFRHQIPAVYNRPKVYHCPQWTHTWKYKNHHDLDVTFIEDPLGIIQTDT